MPYTVRLLLYIATLSTDLEAVFQQTQHGLNFANTTFKNCYKTSLNFTVDNVCQLFNKCRALQFESKLTKGDESPFRVNLSIPTATVVIELPARCRCITEPPSLNDRRIDIITLSTTLPSLVVVMCILAAVLLIIICCRKDIKMIKASVC